MSDLYRRVLMWHKLVCTTTGGLALCSAKRKLNPAEAMTWIDLLRTVADDIESVLHDAPAVLDAKGQRVVGSGAARADIPLPRTREAGHVVVNKSITLREGATDPIKPRVGGPRVARRKQQ